MNVLNVHKRIISQSKDQLEKELQTLSSSDDKVWPFGKWPRMKLNNGLKQGSKGGHGPIRYFVNQIEPKNYIEFKFTYPKGFHGIHRLDIKALNDSETELTHTIRMNTSGKDTLLWIFAVRWLHDALIEDAFDKVESNFDGKERTPQWSWWVKFLRKNLKPKSV